MKTLLVIKASPQMDGSYSRQMAARFTRLWAKNNPEGRVVERDIGRKPVPHVDENRRNGSGASRKNPAHAPCSPDRRVALVERPICKQPHLFSKLLDNWTGAPDIIRV